MSTIVPGIENQYKSPALIYHDVLSCADLKVIDDDPDLDNFYLRPGDGNYTWWFIGIGINEFAPDSGLCNLSYSADSALKFAKDLHGFENALNGEPTGVAYYMQVCGKYQKPSKFYFNNTEIPIKNCRFVYAVLYDTPNDKGIYYKYVICQWEEFKLEKHETPFGLYSDFYTEEKFISWEVIKNFSRWLSKKIDADDTVYLIISTHGGRNYMGYGPGICTGAGEYLTWRLIKKWLIRVFGPALDFVWFAACESTYLAEKLLTNGINSKDFGEGISECVFYSYDGLVPDEGAYNDTKTFIKYLDQKIEDYVKNGREYDIAEFPSQITFHAGLRSFDAYYASDMMIHIIWRFLEGVQSGFVDAGSTPIGSEFPLITIC